METEEAQ